ncbi:MAG: nuclear transport factor 2 family protein [Bacteroidota bacterium]
MPNPHQALIMNYVQAYNAFDVDGMCRDLHQDIHFENVSNGEVSLSLQGLAAFREQAEAAKGYFTERQQIIDSVVEEEGHVTVHIKYKAVLAIDLPNGMKVGDTLEMDGQSIFEFIDGKISHIRDVS